MTSKLHLPFIRCLNNILVHFLDAWHIFSLLLSTLFGNGFNDSEKLFFYGTMHKEQENIIDRFLICHLTFRIKTLFV